MKNKLIKLLGGYTKKQFDAAILLEEFKKNREIDRLLPKCFRTGDAVYLNDKRFRSDIEYYLLESYNNGHYWYVSENPDSTERSELSNGINIKYILFEKPEFCNCCGHILKHE